MAVRMPAGAFLNAAPVGGQYLKSGAAIRSLSTMERVPAPLQYHTRFPEIITGLEVMCKAATEEEAEEILADIRDRAPVDTGTLRDGYHIRHDEFSGFGGEDSDEYFISTEVRYAPFVEFGTVHNAAQPHVLPAVEAGRQRYINRETVAIQEASFA